jgi:hypothetical protein
LNKQKSTQKAQKAPFNKKSSNPFPSQLEEEKKKRKGFLAHFVSGRNTSLLNICGGGGGGSGGTDFIPQIETSLLSFLPPILPLPFPLSIPYQSVVPKLVQNPIIPRRRRH